MATIASLRNNQLNEQYLKHWLIYVQYTSIVNKV